MYSGGSRAQMTWQFALSGIPATGITLKIFFIKDIRILGNIIDFKNILIIIQHFELYEI